MRLGYVIRNGLQWKDPPCDYGPHKTLYDRFVHCSRLGVFDRIFSALMAQAGVPERLMIDSTHLKAHRTAAGLAKKGLFRAASDAPVGAELQAACCLRREGPAGPPAPDCRPDQRPRRRRSTPA